MTQNLFIQRGYVRIESSRTTTQNRSITTKTEIYHIYSSKRNQWLYLWIRNNNQITKY